MRVEHAEPARLGDACEVMLGASSWDPDNPGSKSAKFAWRDKNGRVARGGEVPIEALPQMLDFAIRKGYLTLG